MHDNKRDSIILSLAICLVLMLIVPVEGIIMNNKYDELSKYCCSTAGDMIGSSKSVTVEKHGSNKALVTYSKAESHDAEPVITTYTVDAKLLSDIKAVFIKHRMYSWENRKFTDLFVADGATTSYSFDFGEEEISFSSQIFPAPYRSRLKKIDELIEKYVEEGTKLY